MCSGKLGHAATTFAKAAKSSGATECQFSVQPGVQPAVTIPVTLPLYGSKTPFGDDPGVLWEQEAESSNLSAPNKPDLEKCLWVVRSPILLLGSLLQVGLFNVQAHFAVLRRDPQHPLA